MAQLWSTGPCLIYAGINYSWLNLLYQIFQVPAQTLPVVLQPTFSVLQSGGFSQSAGEPSPGGGTIQVNIQPPPTGARLQVSTSQAIVQFFALLSTSFTPVFLGTGEVAPYIEIDPEWDAVPADHAGGILPADRIYQGEEALIQVDLTRYNEVVYALLASRGQNLTALGKQRGIDVSGTLMNAEQVSYPLWVVFPYVQKLVYGLAGMPACYHFFQAMLEGPDRFTRLGASPRVLGLTWRAQRLVFQEQLLDLQDLPTNYSNIPAVPASIPPIGQLSGSTNDAAVAALYDHDTTGLPLPN